MQQIDRKKQFGLIADALEEKRHGLVQRVALGCQEQAVEFLITAAVELQLHDFLAVKVRQIDFGSVVEDFRLFRIFGMAQDTVTVVQVAMQFHVTYSCKAVEPRIGHRLHGLLEALYPDP